jgi:pSer/pThr/pTyr-binding forkhead associated (FHA) protein
LVCLKWLLLNPVRLSCSAMPSESQNDHLLVITDDTGRRQFPLDAPTYSIGRDPKCDIRLVSQFVSRRHATLVQVPNDEGTAYHYRIIDGAPRGKASANGLLINGRKLQAHNLQNEDEVVFGPGVEAKYHLLQREAYETEVPDEFDITLISPGMIEEDETDQKAKTNKKDEAEKKNEEDETDETNKKNKKNR